MKKIALLIVSMFTGLNAKYQELFTAQTLVTPTELKKIDATIDTALNFTPTKKSSVAQIEAPLLQLSVVQTALNSQATIHRDNVLARILLNNVGSFKGLITYLGNLQTNPDAYLQGLGLQDEPTLNFMVQFKKMFKIDNSLNELLGMELQHCTDIMTAMEGKNATAFELVTLERLQLQLLQDYLTSGSFNPEKAADCLKQLQMYTADKVGLLRRVMPALIIGAPLGVKYLQSIYGDQIAQFGMSMYQYVLSQIPASAHDLAAIAPSVASDLIEQGGQLVLSALDSAMSSSTVQTAGTAAVAAGVGYGAKKMYKGWKHAYEKGKALRSGAPKGGNSDKVMKPLLGSSEKLEINGVPYEILEDDSVKKSN